VPIRRASYRKKSPDPLGAARRELRARLRNATNSVGFRVRPLNVARTLPHRVDDGERGSATVPKVLS
jgi:hypothetical protein